MTTFALIHGAWGTGWHWGTVPGELQRLGHEVVAPDLPCEDPAATFDDYADVVLAALQDVSDDDDVVVVGYSLGGHTAALVAARRPVRTLVYLAALVPEPGVSLNEQFARGESMLLPDYAAGIENEETLTRWVDFDVYHRAGCHDCPEPVARERFERSRGQCRRLYREPCSIVAVADVPTRYILCSQDRMMNNAFWQPTVRAHVDSDPVELQASHSPMASRPVELARVLCAAGSP